MDESPVLNSFRAGSFFMNQYDKMYSGLIIDSNPQDIEIFKSVMQKFNIQIFSATDLKEAAKIHRENRLSLYVLEEKTFDDFDNWLTLEEIILERPRASVFAVKGIIPASDMVLYEDFNVDYFLPPNKRCYSELGKFVIGRLAIYN